MKQWIENLKAGKKEDILILLLFGVLLLVIAVPTKEKENKEILQQEESDAVCTGTAVIERELENRLRSVLSAASGIGRTEVMITLKSEGESIVEKDAAYSQKTEEQGEEPENAASSASEHSETTVYEKDGKGNEKPYVRKKTGPEIDGVLVLAQGGDQAQLVQEITEAVMALFGVEAHKIKVMKME